MNRFEIGRRPLAVRARALSNTTRQPERTARAADAIVALLHCLAKHQARRSEQQDWQPSLFSIAFGAFKPL